MLSHLYASPLTLVFPLALGWAATSDARGYTIPNRVSLLLLAAFPLAAALAPSSADLVGEGAAAGALVLAGGLALWLRGLVGGGDVKLLAAASLWVGLSRLSSFLILVALFGGVLALALLLIRRSRRLRAACAGIGFGHVTEADAGIPYGIAIAAAGLTLYPGLLRAAWS